MNNGYVRCDAGEKCYFIDVEKATTSTGAEGNTTVTGGSVTIVEPGAGAVSLTGENAVKMLNFTRSFEYVSTMLLLRENSGRRDAFKQSMVTANESTKELNIIDFKMADIFSGLELEFLTVDTTNGDIKSKLLVNRDGVKQLLDLMKLGGIVPTVKGIENISWVKSLPDETAVSRNSIYVCGGKNYKLNAAEDAFEEIAAKFVDATILPETKVSADDKTIYVLTRPYDDFSKGMYTYDAAKNEYTISEFTSAVKVAKLDAEKAKEKTYYVLTKDDGDKKAATVWYLEGKEFKSETRTFTTVDTMPNIKVAIDGTYYNMNGVVQYYKDGKYTKIGVLEKPVDVLPKLDCLLNDHTVYVLTEQDGTKGAGTKWIFDMTKKEFVEYKE